HRRGRLPFSRFSKGGAIGSCIPEELRILAENRLLELAKRRTRLDPQLLYQGAACLLVCVQRFNLPPAAVEGEHQLATEALAEGILCDQQLELTNELGPRAESQLRVHQVLKRGGTQLLQAPDHGRGERLEGKVRKRRAAPELERLPQLRGSLFATGGAALTCQALKAAEVDLFLRHLEDVAAPAREQEVRPEQTAELGDVVSQRRYRCSWRFLAPQRVYEHIDGEHFSSTEHENREQRPLFGGAQLERPFAIPHLEGPEDAEVDHKPFVPPTDPREQP